ncbi:MAG: DHH family phosphoesterase, partial [Deltaproteobacteria bacterium]|nr:DHH family phosphoesterase [Deltaproteobacteria bacterium]
MKKRWHILAPDIHSIKNISNALKLSSITSSVLVNRGINSPEQALSFIHVSMEDIRSPFEIKDIDTAVNRIYAAIINKEKILVFGDYDADGITATAILVEFLLYAGVNTDYYIPHRKMEGYGLQTRHISEYAVPNQTNLIITVDCGSSSHDAILAAKQAGIDVIVTDHHNISENLPGAAAVVNPKRHDCDSCFSDLSGVGMAFCLLICLRKYMRDAGFWQNIPEPNLKNACDLVALGTMADIVPLIHENRILVKAGLDIMKYGKRPGVLALIKASKINKATVTEEDIAFKLAPR